MSPSLTGTSAHLGPQPVRGASAGLVRAPPLHQNQSPHSQGRLTGLGASLSFSSAILRLDLYVSLSGSSSRAFL